jgi:hypothetical protein
MNKRKTVTDAKTEKTNACGESPKRKEPVRVLNDALHEYRTKQTTMSKEEFYERGCYAAFMWAWQRASSNAPCGKEQPVVGGPNE